jgi:ubiquinone/menaquinone biosynthesis C-methylase UbiE
VSARTSDTTTGTFSERTVPSPARTKAYRGVAMEGSIARWYARTRGTESQLALWRQQADDATRDLAAGAEVLEIAPGPGFFAVELAKLGRVRVSALEISHTFVEIATENARRAGVTVHIERGDAAHMPYADRSFDRVLCQAAFKNFSQPQEAVNEMHRVLRPGGSAWIEDMRHDATNAAIQQEVDAMDLSPFRALMTRRVLKSLRGRAYSPTRFDEFARASPFRSCEIRLTPIGVEVRLRRPAEATAGPSSGG